MDTRWTKLGGLLVDYSAHIRPGEKVMIAMGEVESFPLALAVYEATIKAEGYPQVQFLSEKLRRALLKFGTESQLGWVPEIEAYGMQWADVYIGLRGAYNLAEHWDIPAARLSLNQAALGRISTLRWEQTRWCLVRVPNAALAQQARVDEETLTEMFFAACLLDWEAEARKWRAWAERLNRAERVRIVGRDTDLSFSVQGRPWVVGDGRINMPDGEIATAPVEETVDGQITFEFPGVLGGRLVDGIRLRWQRGTLTEAIASVNQDFLRSIVRSDEGASRIGEFGFGTNPHVTRFCTDILIDEKIGGTVHVALGRAYPEMGGKNRSAIHWDIVKDLRAEGAVYVDGQAVLQGGRFLF
jgi:aminopeptidase